MDFEMIILVKLIYLEMPPGKILVGEWRKRKGREEVYLKVKLQDLRRCLWLHLTGKPGERRNISKPSLSEGQVARSLPASQSLAREVNWALDSWSFSCDSSLTDSCWSGRLILTWSPVRVHARYRNLRYGQSTSSTCDSLSENDFKV